MARPSHLSISELNRSLLLRDVVAGAASFQVGFEDAERTMEQNIRHLTHRVRPATTVVESSLWSSNLLNEIEEWAHPSRITFDEWLEEMLGDELVFDKFWNTIEERRNV